jgi:hypothetical protein
MTIIEVVQLLGLGARLVESGTQDPSIQWVLVRLADGRRLLVVERTYREGSTVLMEPSDEEIARCRTDPWTAWNATRADEDAILKCAPVTKDEYGGFETER